MSILDVQVLVQVYRRTDRGDDSGPMDGVDTFPQEPHPRQQLSRVGVGLVHFVLHRMHHDVNAPGLSNGCQFKPVVQRRHHPIQARHVCLRDVGTGDGAAWVEWYCW